MISVQASDETVECDGNGNQAQLAAWLASNGGASASDVCSGVEWSNDFTALSDDCGATGSATVTFKATDDCGNYSETTATFTIVDTTNPSIDTQASDETVECDGNGNQAQLAAWLASNGGALASDVCSGVEWSNDFTALSDDCGATGSATVTFKATDDCGNYSETTATFTIVDTTNPSIDTEASDETVECDGNGNQAQLAAWLASNGGASASDVCSGVIWSNNFTALSDDCGATGSATVTFRATDDCGNFSETTATFTIEDTTNPSIDTVSSDETVECDGQGNQAELAAWLASNGGAVASDVCSGVIWTNNFTALSDDCGATGSATVTFRATDDCGNFSETTATFTIEDTTNPSIDTVSSDETVECDGQGNQAELAAWLASNGGAVASDVCSGVIWTNNFTALSDDCGATGSATVTFRATDDCGNYSETTATFTIEDTTDPTIDTPAANLTVDCDGKGNQAQLDAWLASNGGASASDVCSGVTWSDDFESFTGVCGSVEVTFTATDACGNSSDTTATFTINPIAIVANCPGDFTGSDCDELVIAEFATWISSFSYTGGCGTITATDLSSYVLPAPNTSITITYEVVDECGQTVSCFATFYTPDCFDGCTLGYWKNQTENWCDAYSTGDFYGDIFVNAPTELSGLTLLQVLNVTGGGIYNLGRQSVAALLNICHEDVNYSSPYTNDIALLISDVNAAFGQGGNPGALGSQLDLLNQVGCSIDAHGNTISERVVGGEESLVTGTMFTVYPIPFKDNITIKYGFDYQSNVTIELFDFMGTLVYKSIDTKPYLNKEETISTYFTERNSSQFYVIRITTDREVSTQTVVKSK
jgi:GH43 family beta-xylosidase